MKNCMIGQSGGPTAAINASLCGAAAAAMESSGINRVFGLINGIQGLLQETMIDLTEVLSGTHARRLLKTTPAAYLGSCRYKLPQEGEVYEEIFRIFQKYDIGYFFYIGGNDSMDTVDKLSRYAAARNHSVRIIGIPKTIDNDLMETDHAPGFGSAAKYIAASVREIALDSNVYDLNSVTIIEIMGRDAGWLTAASALARTSVSSAPHLIYLPEHPFSRQAFLADIRALHKRGVKNVVAAVSEGIRSADGEYICNASSSGQKDVFGHTSLSGTAKVLEALVRSEMGCKARGIELNTSQRCAAHFTSLTDLEESFAIGEAGVKEAESGGTGKMMCFVRTMDTPYRMRIESREISKIANGEKCVPNEWIVSGNDVSQDMITYLQPLIFGEPELCFEKGLPVYLDRASVPLVNPSQFE